MALGEGHACSCGHRACWQGVCCPCKFVSCGPVPGCFTMVVHTTVMLRESCPAEWVWWRSDGIMDQLERFLLVASGDELTGMHSALLP